MLNNRTKGDDVKQNSRAQRFSRNFRADIPILLFQFALFISIFGFTTGEKAFTENNFARQVTWVFFGLFAFINIFRDYITTRNLNYTLGGMTVWLVIIYVFTSATWSIYFFVTIKRSILLLVVLLLAISCFGKKQKDNIALDRVLVLPLFILIVISIIATLFAPNFTITDIGWRGATSHKNEIGQAIIIALFSVIFGAPQVRISLIWRALLILILFAGLIFSRSSTSLVAFSVTVMFIFGVDILLLIRRDIRWFRLLLVISLLSLAAVHIAFLIDVLPSFSQINAFLLGILGKSTTLTGRTELWDLVLSQSLYHNTLLGGGYGGFWNGPYSIASYTTIRNGIYLGQAHNGYIDLYNDLGWLGLALVALVVIKLVLNIISLIRSDRSEWKFLAAILVSILIINFAESTLMRTTQFLNIIFLASYIYSQKLLLRNKD